jgi:hypothetical protein
LNKDGEQTVTKATKTTANNKKMQSSQIPKEKVKKKLLKLQKKIHETIWQNDRKRFL